jgi:hypothetical protein
VRLTRLRLLTTSLLFAGLFAGSATAQPPRIGAIDFYGLRKVGEAKVRETLGVKEGDPLPPSKGDVEDRLADLQGVVESHLEAVCCEAGDAILYVGIEEKGSPHFELRDPPGVDIKLPGEITTAYFDFLQASSTAVRLGEDRDDLTHGHRLSANPQTRAVQEQFIALAKDHLKDLRDVLRTASDEDQRATAAYVIGYAPRKSEVVNDLEYALKDADAGVRGNATHSLVAFAVLEHLDPSSAVKVSPTWFIEMLNSLSWTDRSEALMALQILTDDRDQMVLDQLRDRALPALVEMARWKTLAHALPAYVLLGRIGGIPEKEIQDEWSRGDRDTVIAAATRKKK